MTEHEILAGAQERIGRHRSAPVELRLVDGAGKPLKGVKARVTLARHEFKLGANAYRLGNLDDPGLARAYEERFKALLNYATLPFYWGQYEPKPGKANEARLDSMAEWCRAHRITTKGHPLVWHEVFPGWAKALDDAEVLRRQEARVREIVSRFAGRIDIWDVVNEATVSHRFDNAVGRWIARGGAADCVARSLGWAREANPRATLLYNDFNVSPEFEALAGALLGGRAPVHALGIQSHMHKGAWTIDKTWDVCETYARFGLPLHFTELTVVSGRLKGADDDDWHAVRTDWPTTSDGEARQADDAGQFYTTLFSHPAVEAITWWDFSDNGSWQGAPSGLVRKDMSPKPLYDRLTEAFLKRWATDATVTTDADGRAPVRCFFGEHHVEGTTESGRKIRAAFTLSRRGARSISVTA